MRPAGLALRAGDLADGLAGLGLFLPRVSARSRQISSVIKVQWSGFDPATCGFEELGTEVRAANSSRRPATGSTMLSVASVAPCRLDYALVPSPNRDQNRDLQP